MVRCLALAALFLSCSLAFAIEVGTSVASVAHEGSHETVGSITLTLADNDLAAASFETPIYIRLGLNQSRGWSESLVDLRPGSNLAVPINLALFPKDGAVLNPALPVDAVQLVRLIEGEHFAWIKVTSSSTFWTMISGNPAPPAETRKVSMTIGVRGFLSVRDGANTPSGGNEYADIHDLADTRLLANYLNTPSFINGDLETVDLIAFDHNTTGVELADPHIGNNTGIGFTNDYIVARAVNFYPCFEYHFKDGVYETPAHTVALSSLDLVQRRTYNHVIPAVFFTNSSDFDWEPGSSFFLVHDSYNPDYAINGTSPPSWYNPEVPVTHLLSVDLQMTVTAGTSGWQIEKLFFNDRFMGYRLHLITGRFKPYESLRLEGLKLTTTVSRPDEVPGALKLTAWGLYRAQGVNTTPDPRLLPPIQAVTAKLTQVQDRPQLIMPYVPWDRPTLDFWAHLANPHDQPTRYSLVIYHSFGLIQRVVGDQTLPPHGAVTIPFNQWQEKKQMGWVAIYSERPLAAVGEIRDKAGETLDIYTPTQSLVNKLYGAHVTAGSEWSTQAYMVSGDPLVDPTFTYRTSHGNDDRLVSGFLVPSGTGDLDEADFTSSGNRATWFEVDAGTDTGAGLMIYNTHDQRMMATVPMESQPRGDWRYEHVGNEGNGWFNGLVLTNPNAEQAQVTLTGYTNDGQVLASVTFAIMPRERRVDLLPNLLATATSIARLHVHATRPILSFMLLGREEGDRLTTIPGDLASSTELELPYLPSANDYWIGLALINRNNTEVTARLRPLNAAGVAGAEVQVVIPAGAKRQFALSELVVNASQYTHMRITADLAIDAFAITGSLDNRRLATLPLHAVSTP